MNPSDVGKDKTFQHDDLHLWLNNTENLIDVINTIHGGLNRTDVEILQRQREVNLYSKTGFLIGRPDSIVDYSLGGKKYVLLIELKPTLPAASSVIGQVKAYVDHLDKEYFDYKRRKVLAKVQAVIVTYSVSEKYDELYHDDALHIHIYRVPKK